MAKSRTKQGSSEHAHGGRAGEGDNAMETAQQIWLAGMGAFAKAQSEGGKWFEALVNEGAALDAKTRGHVESSVRQLRENVEDAAGKLREHTLTSWDNLEKIFEGRVARAIETLGVPGHEELAALTRRVEEMSRELRKLARDEQPRKPATNRKTT